MKHLFLALLAIPSCMMAQTITFDTADYRAVGVYDTWEESPFRTGQLEENAAVVINDFCQPDPVTGQVLNPSPKVLAVQRSRHAGNTFGVRIDLHQPFELTPATRYVHVLIHKPVGGRVMLIGLGKRRERAGQSPEAEQFWSMSETPVTPGRWCDAVFPIKGAGGIDIHSLVVVPHCESPHDMAEDFIACIDEISISTDAAPRIALDDYRVSFSRQEKCANPTRRLATIGLYRGRVSLQQLTLPDDATAYTDLTGRQLLATPGETLTPVIAYTGNYMHGYFYLDWDSDGAFSVQTDGLTGRPVEGTDLLSYSYCNGLNSAGAKVVPPKTIQMPPFTLPKDLKPGFYRLRFKVDSNSTDPAGSDVEGRNFVGMGGAIADVRLNVHAATCHVTNQNRNGSVVTPDGTALDGIDVPFGEPFTIMMVPSGGFTHDGIIVRHGYNLSGPRLLRGTPQYAEERVPASSFVDGRYTIPAEFMDGDVQIEGLFVEEAKN